MDHTSRLEGPTGPNALEVLRTSSMSRVVQGEIEKIILSGVYGPGEKLNEKALADRLGVSRGPVREAFQALNARGLVEMIPNRGVFVQQITRHDAVAIYDVRAGLFGTACRLLAERITARFRATSGPLIFSWPQGVFVVTRQGDTVLRHPKPREPNTAC